MYVFVVMVLPVSTLIKPQRSILKLELYYVIGKKIAR